MKNALTVQKKDTGQWKEVGPKQSDLILAHTSGDNTLFHLIEVTRQRSSQQRKQ